LDIKLLGFCQFSGPDSVSGKRGGMKNTCLLPAGFLIHRSPRQAILAREKLRAGDMKIVLTKKIVLLKGDLIFILSDQTKG
jgi:hypothetical protein